MHSATSSPTSLLGVQPGEVGLLTRDARVTLRSRCLDHDLDRLFRLGLHRPVFPARAQAQVLRVPGTGGRCCGNRRARNSSTWGRNP